MPAVDLQVPATYAGALVYDHSDVPPGVTLTAWRRQRARLARAQRTGRRAARRRLLVEILTLRAARTRRRRQPSSAAVA